MNCVSSEETLYTNPIFSLKYIIIESTNIIMWGSKNRIYLIASELYIFRGTTSIFSIALGLIRIKHSSCIFEYDKEQETSYNKQTQPTFTASLDKESRPRKKPWFHL